MARRIEDLVQAARDYHPTFDEPRHPTGPTYRALSQIVQTLQNATLSLLPDFVQIAIVTSFPLPLASFADGLALPACRLVNELVALGPIVNGEQLEFEVALISADQRFARNSPRTAAWQDGDSLFLRGPASRWEPYVSIEVNSVPVFSDASVEALQLPAAVLPLPDDAAPAVIAQLAAFFARRSDTIDAQRRAGLVTDANTANDAYNDAIVNRKQGISFYTGDTYGDGPG